MHMCMFNSKSCKRKQSACLVWSSSLCSCLGVFPRRARPKIEHRKELVHTSDGLDLLGVKRLIHCLTSDQCYGKKIDNVHRSVMCEDMKTYKSLDRRDDYRDHFFQSAANRKVLFVDWEMCRIFRIFDKVQMSVSSIDKRINTWTTCSTK